MKKRLSILLFLIFLFSTSIIIETSQASDPTKASRRVNTHIYPTPSGENFGVTMEIEKVISGKSTVESAEWSGEIVTGSSENLFWKRKMSVTLSDYGIERLKEKKIKLPLGEMSYYKLLEYLNKAIINKLLLEERWEGKRISNIEDVGGFLHILLPLYSSQLRKLTIKNATCTSYNWKKSENVIEVGLRLGLTGEIISGSEKMEPLQCEGSLSAADSKIFENVEFSFDLPHDNERWKWGFGIPHLQDILGYGGYWDLKENLKEDDVKVFLHSVPGSDISDLPQWSREVDFEYIWEGDSAGKLLAALLSGEGGYSIGHWRPEPGAEIGFEPEERRGLPGRELSYSVEVTNTGPSPDNFKLETGDTYGWSLSLENNQIRNLKPYQEKDTTLHVSIPKDAPHKRKNIIRLRSVSDLGGKDEETAIAKVSRFSISVETDKKRYEMGETVKISGEAEYANGAPIEKQIVRIDLFSGNSREEQEFKQVEEGKFDWSYSLPPGTAGIFSVEANLNPSISPLSLKDRAEFMVYGLSLIPQTNKIDMAVGTENEVTFRLFNFGETKLTNLRLNLEDKNEEDGLTATLDTDNLKKDLSPGDSTSFSLELASEAEARVHEARFIVKVSTEEGSSEKARVNVELHSREPVPVVEPKPIKVSLSPGQQEIESITFRNNGYGPWENVNLTEVQIPWITFVQSPRIDDIPPQEDGTLDLYINPPRDTQPGEYRDEFTVTSSNFSPISESISVNVNSENGFLRVHTVSNLGHDLPDCSVILNSLEDDRTFTAETNSGGWAELKVPPGRYKCVIRGQKDSKTRNLQIDPGATKDVKFFLKSPPNIPVPAPASIPPEMLELSGPPGGSVRTSFQILNIGRVGLENVTVTPTGGSELSVDLVPSYIRSINPKESVEIEVKAKIGKMADFGDNLRCKVEIKGTYTIKDIKNTRKVYVSDNLLLNCRVKPYSLQFDPSFMLAEKSGFENRLRKLSSKSGPELLSSESELFTQLGQYGKAKLETIHITNKEKRPIWLTRANGLCSTLSAGEILASEISKPLNWVINRSPFLRGENGYFELVDFLLKFLENTDNCFVTLHGYLDNAPEERYFKVEPGETVPLKIWGVPQVTPAGFASGESSLPRNMGGITTVYAWWDKEDVGQAEHARKFSIPFLLLDSSENSAFLSTLTEGMELIEGIQITPTPKPRVSLSVSPHHQTGTPGETVSYGIETTTFGQTPRNYRLIAETPWPAELGKDIVSSRERTNLNVKIPENTHHGEKAEIEIIAVAPENKKFENSVTLTARCSIAPRLLVRPERKIAGKEGQTLEYEIMLKNLGSRPENYRLNVVNQKDLQPDFEDETLNVNPGKTETTTLTVTIPPEMDFGEAKQIKVEATPEKVPRSQRSTTVTAQLHRIVQIDPEEIYRYPGENANYFLKISNPFENRQTFQLSVENHWPAILEKSRVKVPPNDYKYVKMVVKIPKDAGLGETEEIKANASFKQGKPTDKCKAGVQSRLPGKTELYKTRESLPVNGSFTTLLDISNDMREEMTDLEVDLNVLSGENENLSNLFQVDRKDLSDIDDISGGGTIETGETATARWKITPNRKAAENTTENYKVIAEVKYEVKGLANALRTEKSFTVHPLPKLKLDYYLPTGYVGKGEPFFLAMRAKNIGRGIAKTFTVRSSLPTIIRNQESIPVYIEETWIGKEHRLGWLNVHLGDIPPGGSKVTLWKLSTDQPGKITRFEIEPDLFVWGRENTTLVEGIDNHNLMREVIKDTPEEDEFVDLLVDKDEDGKPDFILDPANGKKTELRKLPEQIAKKPTIESPEMVIHVEKREKGWVYISAPSQVEKDVGIREIVRGSDNKRLDDRNYWRENGKVHIIDDPAENYLVKYNQAQMREISITVAPQLAAGSAGENLEYELRIKNDDESEENILIEARDNLSWNISLNPSSMIIPPKGEENSLLTVEIPEDVQPGTRDNLLITALFSGTHAKKDTVVCKASTVVSPVKYYKDFVEPKGEISKSNVVQAIKDYFLKGVIPPIGRELRVQDVVDVIRAYFGVPGG